MPKYGVLSKNKKESFPPIEDDDDEFNDTKEESRKFILVTADYSGLGFCIQETEKNGSEVIIGYKPKDGCERKEDHELVCGNGWLKSFDLDELFENREEYRDYYWVWDGNHNYDIHDTIKQEGFLVSDMGSEFTYNLENDREFGLEFAESAGLMSPEHEEFSSFEEGISFLEKNEDKAYVFKPNNSDESHLTTVPNSEYPKNANVEIRQLIKALKINDFVLQELVKGVEVNLEVWYVKGVPTAAIVNLECKKHYVGDIGHATGCSFDVCWSVDINDRIIMETVRKFDDKLMEMEYTGFADANVIVGEDEIYFLEFCFRPGYNAHPNVFNTISKKTFLQTMADMIDGTFVCDFKRGFGSSVTLFTGHPYCGIPIYIPDAIRENVYLFDAYREFDESGEEIIMSGGEGKEIAIVTAHNYTIESAFHDAMNNASKVVFTNKYNRTDCHKKDFNNSPRKRYEALKVMEMI